MNKPPFSIGFAGTPTFAANILKSLLDAGYLPKLVLTQPDRARGRGKKLSYSAVKQLAQQNQLPVLQPESLKGEAGDSAYSQLESLNLDILVVAAYGLILPDRILKLPKYGCLNIHTSLLPKWRGAAPIERSIMAGDAVSGVSIMRMDAGMDTGPIYAFRCVKLDAKETGDSLLEKLAKVGASATLQSLQEIDTLQPMPQNDAQSSYAAKLTSGDSLLNWQKSALELERKIRALNSRQPAYSFINKERIRILSADVLTNRNSPEQLHTGKVGTVLKSDKSGCEVLTGDGVLKILNLQLARGKGKVMPFAAALNGYPRLFLDACFENGD